MAEGGWVCAMETVKASLRLVWDKEMTVKYGNDDAKNRTTASVCVRVCVSVKKLKEKND